MAPKQKILRLLYDADLFIFNACAKAEDEWAWPGGLHTIYSQTGECRSQLDHDIQQTGEYVLKAMKWEGEFEIILVLSDPQGNFRKDFYPDYKANRADKRKPLCYWDTVDWAKEHYTTKQALFLEADDVLGIMSTTPSEEYLNVIISKDKDFRSIPGYFYCMQDRELLEITQEEADYFHLYQTLIGDTSDNYPGCPGVGPVKAKTALDKDPSWDTVVGLYEKAKLTETDALTQARVARILRHGEYVKVAGNWEVKLWNP